MTDTPEGGTESRRNSLVGTELRAFVDRIERLEEERQARADDIRAVYAEAKAKGYTPKWVRHVVKERRKAPSERDEEKALADLYESAAGLARELPLFRAAGLMGVDVTAKEAVIEALKQLVPATGEIVVKIGGPPLRLWRDKDQAVHSEEVVDAPKRSAAPTPPAVGRPGADAPACSEDEAEELGRAAATADKPIIANPFAWDDKRRARWDLGWRKQSGGDGMGPDD